MLYFLPHDLFLSYSSANALTARRIVTRLGDFGYSIWHYKAKKNDGSQIIPPGLSWWEVISEQVLAAQAVMVLVSERSMRSPVVREEVELARLAVRRVLLLLHRMDNKQFRRLCKRWGLPWDRQFTHFQSVCVGKGVSAAIQSLLNGLEAMGVVPGKTDSLPKMWNIRHVEQLETQASEMHVVTPDFFWDLSHPHYKEVVRANLQEGKKYVYYFPKCKQFEADRVKALHRLSPNTRQLQFVPMPDAYFKMVPNEKVIYLESGSLGRLVDVDMENHRDASAYDYLQPSAECQKWMEILRNCKHEHDAGLRRKRK